MNSWDWLATSNSEFQRYFEVLFVCELGSIGDLGMDGSLFCCRLWRIVFFGQRGFVKSSLVGVDDVFAKDLWLVF